MTVYAEVLFVENFITGWVILTLAGKVRGYRPDTWRIGMGAVMCGGYAFILFVQLHWLYAIAAKIVFSLLVVLIVFGWSTMRNLLKNAGVFYIVSFLMGGVTLAMMYMLKIPGMTGNGSFMMKGIPFVQIGAGVAVTWYLASWLSGLLREKVMRDKVLHWVIIELGDHRWQLQALADTGNSLKEPITGKTVAVLSGKISEEMTEIIDAENILKQLMIPYKTVSGSGIMPGIVPDRITVDGCEVKDVILGLGKRDFFPWHGCEKYDLLLHQQFIEGEEKDYGEKYYDDRSRRIRERRG